MGRPRVTRGWRRCLRNRFRMQTPMFQQLFGFPEGSHAEVQARLRVQGDHLISTVNGASYACGRLEIPSLSELRDQVAALKLPPNPSTCREIVGDARAAIARRPRSPGTSKARIDFGGGTPSPAVRPVTASPIGHRRRTLHSQWRPVFPRPRAEAFVPPNRPAHGNRRAIFHASNARLHRVDRQADLSAIVDTGGA